jgi:CubicO group peptidase (beta-lactamase class C family)
MLFSLFIAVLSLTGLASGTDSSRSTYDFAPVRSFILRTLAEKRVPSISVAVAKNGQILWEEAFGLADREKMTLATPQTIYSLASITKPFTATAVMELLEKQKIDLDRPINDYLGNTKLTGLAGDASAATIRRVLSHTAGLPLHYHFFYENSGDELPDMAETIERYGIIVHPPGLVWEYSNLGYGILGYAVSCVSQLDYADYLRTQVFLPLGMTHSFVGIGSGLHPYAQRYDEEQRVLPWFDFDHRGASAIYATAHDLVRFGMFHLKDHLKDQEPILKDATLDTMKIAANTTATAGAQHKVAYGLGWQINPDDHGYLEVGHEGAMTGATTILNLYPKEDLAIVVLANTFNENAVVDTAQQIAAAVLPKYAAALHAPGAPNVKPPETKLQPTSDLLGQWVGSLHTWQRTIPLSLTFQPDGDIHVKVGDELEALLNEIVYKDGNLMGRFAGTIPTPDATRHPHTIQLNVFLRNGKLSGEASAVTWDTPLNYFALSSYVELSKKIATK